MPLRRLGMIIVLGITIAALVVGLAACGKSKSKTAAAPLNVEANTVIGSEGATNPANICVVSSRFQQGQSVVWRIKVYDPVTGKPMDDSTLSSVTVSLPDGQTFSAKYGGHPGQPGATPTDYFWSTVWSISKDYPTGSVSYKVAATSKDGRTGSFNEFNVAPSLLTVIPAAAAAPLNVEANTVIGSQGVKNPADICVVSSRFQQGLSVVWRIKVYDPVTGKPMDDSTLSSVMVSLPDGQTFNAKYGGHPGQPGVTPTDYFWSTAWSIPKDYPTGSVPYKVAATSKDGRTGSFNEFNVAPSLLTVVPAQ